MGLTTFRTCVSRPFDTRVMRPLALQAHILQPVESTRFVSGDASDASLANTPGGCPRVNDSGSEYFSDEDSRPVILFDGACNLCNGGVQFVLDWDKESVFRFASLQSEAGKALLKRSGRAPGVPALVRNSSILSACMHGYSTSGCCSFWFHVAGLTSRHNCVEDISSIVLVTKQRHWIKSTAVLKIAEELKAPVPVLSALLQPIPGFVRDSVYKVVSTHRYSIFGEANQCRMMIPEWRARFLY